MRQALVTGNRHTASTVGVLDGVRGQIQRTGPGRIEYPPPRITGNDIRGVASVAARCVSPVAGRGRRASKPDVGRAWTSTSPNRSATNFRLARLMITTRLAARGLSADRMMQTTSAPDAPAKAACTAAISDTPRERPLVERGGTMGVVGRVACATDGRGAVLTDGGGKSSSDRRLLPGGETGVRAAVGMASRRGLG